MVLITLLEVFRLQKAKKLRALYDLISMTNRLSLSLQPKQELIKLNEEKAIIKIVAKW